jgi:hypothetical protein
MRSSAITETAKAAVEECSKREATEKASTAEKKEQQDKSSTKRRSSKSSRKKDNISKRWNASLCLHFSITLLKNLKLKINKIKYFLGAYFFVSKFKKILSLPIKILFKVMMFLSKDMKLEKLVFFLVIVLNL